MSSSHSVSRGRATRSNVQAPRYLRRPRLHRCTHLVHARRNPKPYGYQKRSTRPIFSGPCRIEPTTIGLRVVSNRPRSISADLDNACRTATSAAPVRSSSGLVRWSWFPLRSHSGNADEARVDTGFRWAPRRADELPRELTGPPSVGVPQDERALPEPAGSSAAHFDRLSPTVWLQRPASRVSSADSPRRAG